MVSKAQSVCRKAGGAGVKKDSPTAVAKMMAKKSDLSRAQKQLDPIYERALAWIVSHLRSNRALILLTKENLEFGALSSQMQVVTAEANCQDGG